MTWKVGISENRVQIGDRFAISFQRTLRIPEDGKTYPLPPTLGVFQIHKVSDYSDRLPKEWLESSDPFHAVTSSVFISMFQREALWLAFEAESWKPNAVKVGIGGINALTGDKLEEGLHSDPQDYLVCPTQPWLDGINTGDGEVRQFVAMPLGEGYTVEGQLTGREEVGGLQIVVYDPRPGVFPDQPPTHPGGEESRLQVMEAAQTMGLAPGGRIVQKIYPDPYGIQTWDQKEADRLSVFILNSLQYQQISGGPLPSTPISARTYTEYGFPWFALYDEGMGDLPASDKLRGLKSVGEKDAKENQPPTDEDHSIEIDSSQIKKIE